MKLQASKIILRWNHVPHWYIYIYPLVVLNRFYFSSRLLIKIWCDIIFNNPISNFRLTFKLLCSLEVLRIPELNLFSQLLLSMPESSQSWYQKVQHIHAIYTFPCGECCLAFSLEKRVCYYCSMLLNCIGKSTESMGSSDWLRGTSDGWNVSSANRHYHGLPLDTNLTVVLLLPFERRLLKPTISAVVTIKNIE